MCVRIVTCCWVAQALGALAVGERDRDVWLSPDAELSLQGAEFKVAQGSARVLSGSSLGSLGTASRSVVIIDGVDDWHEYGSRMFRSILKSCARWEGQRASDDTKVNSYICNDKGVKTSYGAEASDLLARFQKDPSVTEAIKHVYGVEAAGCWLGRPDGGGIGINILNQSMEPDSFHADTVCENPPSAEHNGLTMLIYPHDTWEDEWRSHLELASPDGRTLARISPRRSRLVIIDACVAHRATNPTLQSRPVGGTTPVSPALNKLLGDGKSRPSFHFNGWRFAIVMQMKCPLVSADGVCTAGQGAACGATSISGEDLFRGPIPKTVLPDGFAPKPRPCTLEKVDAASLEYEPLRAKPRIIVGAPEHLGWRTDTWTLENFSTLPKYEEVTISAHDGKDVPYMFEALQRVNRSASKAWMDAAPAGAVSAERLKVREWVGLWRAFTSSPRMKVPEDSGQISTIDGMALDLHPPLQRDYAPFTRHFGDNVLRDVWQLTKHIPEKFPADVKRKLTEAAAFWSQMKWRYLIVGMAGAGGAMHQDPYNEGFWNTMLVGRKRWLLMPFSSIQELMQKDPGIKDRWNKGAGAWYSEEYARLVRAGVYFEECVMQPGEMVYGPPGWYHVVLALEDSISVSEQLVTRQNLGGYTEMVADMIRRESSPRDAPRLLSLFCLPLRVLAKMEQKKGSTLPPLDKVANCHKIAPQKKSS